MIPWFVRFIMNCGKEKMMHTAKYMNQILDQSLPAFDELFDDFILTPFRHQELEARLKHLFWSQGVDSRGEVLTHGDLSLNLETYQAAVNGRPLDLTYMEYELLKFLVSHPGKVFSRETLLSRVG